ncbi:TraY domain-containing protein [Reyranella sp.]|uniref:type II toxin-antitoxin system RelB family antitoxin n=1 Tax=Reyranella sp. TaxID=1929291 RepID=UPI002600F909|nr:TraY domain-containing protein [Reyranella sp.]
MLAVRLTPAVEKRLERLARRTGRTKEFHARRAIQDHLDDIEDAEVALRRLRRPAKRVPIGEVARRRNVRLEDLNSTRVPSASWRDWGRSENPTQFGKALTGPYAGPWRYRVSDWRIIARLERHRPAGFAVREWGPENLKGEIGDRVVAGLNK